MGRRVHAHNDQPRLRQVPTPLTRKVLGVTIEKRIHKPSDLADKKEAWRDIAADALAKGLVVWLVAEEGIDELLITNPVVAPEVPKLGHRSPAAA